MGKALPDITIIRDTREKEGWVWEPEEKKPGKVRIAGMEVAGLTAGDYSIVGAEHIVRIERKNGFGELFGNMSPKSHKERFEREMEKLEDIPLKYIVIETSLNEDTLGLSVPQMRSGPPASSVLKWLTELQMTYGVHIIWAGDCGKKVAETIFRQVARRHLQ